MRYSAQIYVTDLLDEVVVHCVIQEWDGMSRAPFPLTSRTASVLGKGLDDPIEWLNDALNRTLETGPRTDWSDDSS